MPDFETCNNCGYEWDFGGEDEHFVYCLDCDCGYCPENDSCPCGCDRRDSYAGIRNWDYKPIPVMFGAGPFHFGFELEIGTDRRNATPVYEWSNDVLKRDLLYAKEDGSVAGFEIVSHPMTREYFDSVPWNAFFDMLNAEYPVTDYYGLDESEEHGLHIHVSRTAFPRRSLLARWTYMIHRNRHTVERIARRRGTHWARFADRPVRECLPPLDYALVPGLDTWNQSRDDQQRIIAQYRRTHQTTDTYPERYRAVNQTNGPTVEVRVFRSTRRPEDLRNAFHLVSSTVDYVRDNATLPRNTRESVRWSAYLGWLNTRPEYAMSFPAIAGEI